MRIARRRTLAHAALAFALLGAAGTATAAAHDQPQTIPLTDYLGVVPSLDVDVHGRAVRLLLDTAGGLSILTPDFAHRLGCAPWGKVTGFRMRGDRVDAVRCDAVHLDVGGTPLTIPTAGVWDFSHLLPKNAPPLGGSLALDAFAGRTVTLDLAGHRLILETPASEAARIRHAVEVPVRFERDAGGLALTPLVAVQTSRGSLWMELDCGSDAPLIVDRHAAALLHLDPAGKHGQPLAMTLAGGVPVHGEALVQDLIIDGNIGAPILRQWVVTLDLAQQRAWIAPRATERAHRQAPDQSAATSMPGNSTSL